jgi:hypothetical protein
VKKMFLGKSVWGIVLNVSLTLVLVLFMLPFCPYTTPVLASPGNSSAGAPLAELSAAPGGTASPDGRTLLAATSFENSNWDNWGHTARTADGITGIVQRVIDPTAPQGNYVCEFIFPEGFPGGNEPGIVWSPGFEPQEEIWFEFYFKLSANWQWHPFVQKLVYFRCGELGEANHTLVIGYDDYAIALGTQHESTYGSNNQMFSYGKRDQITKNVWHKVEIRCVMNTPGVYNGIGQVWWNDQLVIDVDDVLWLVASDSGKFVELTLVPVFGGKESKVNQQMNLRYDDVKIYAPASFNGAVLYQTSVLPAKIELYDAQGTLVAAAATAINGAYTLAAPAGVGYTLKVTKPGYLSYTIKNLTLTNGENIETIDIRQMAGDIDGDGIVDATDLTCLLSEFGRAPVNFPNADIDGDGIVNATDLTYLLAGFNKHDVVINKNE